MLTTPGSLAAAPISLTAKAPAGELLRVRMKIEATGELRLNPHGKEVIKTPLTLSAEHEYDERRLAAGPTATKVRHYRTARSSFAYGAEQAEKFELQLRPERRLIAVDRTPGAATVFSPAGSLKREELELVDTYTARFDFARLLPTAATETGREWPIAPELLVDLLGLDVTTQAAVTAKLVAADAATATIELAGTVDGAIGGVATAIELKARLQFDRAAGRVSQFSLALKENRSIAHAEPGFEAVVKLAWASAPLARCDELADAALRGLPLAANAATTSLEFAAQSGGFAFVHDRRWRVLTDQREVTILRLVDRGDLIAQCNITPLAALPEGKELALEGFEQEVRKALAKNLGQVLESTQMPTQQGLRALRVTATGAAGEIPIRWVYYHLNDEHRRRASYVFTLEESLVERLANADVDLTHAFRFIALPDADKSPTPAARTAAEPATDATR